MSGVFKSLQTKGLKLDNRLARSATWEGMCEPDGRPTRKLAELYCELARGKVGLIITGYTFVRTEGKQLPGKMGIHTSSFADDYKKMVDSVHDCGGKICIQLVHAGGQTDTNNAGRQPLAPSSIATPQFPEIPAELTLDEIREIIFAFANSAKRAKDYGFDAIQLHGAHGYLINQFLSPLTNKRTDEYGGSIENRSRFLMEVYDAARKEVGSEYPLMIKLNGDDFIDGGMSSDEALYAARKLDEKGIALIEVSGGTPASGDSSPVRMKINSEAQEAYNLHLAKRIKSEVNCPVYTVGGLRSLHLMEKAIAENIVDGFSMARPFIREPFLAKRWYDGDTSKATCISCNGCFMPGIKEGGIYCVADKKDKESLK